MTTYVGNAFSLSMVKGSVSIVIRTLTNPEIATAAYYGRDAAGVCGRQWVSCFGHTDIAKLAEISAEVHAGTWPTNRLSVQLFPGDKIMVAQYVGPRLSEGATALPEGAAIEWKEVSVSALVVRDYYAEEEAKAKEEKRVADTINDAYFRGTCDGRESAMRHAFESAEDCVLRKQREANDVVYQDGKAG